MPPLEFEDPIHIRFGTVPASITGVEFADGPVQANGSEYLFQFPGLLSLYLKGRNWITVDAVPGCDRDVLWAVIIGVGATIAGLRRGRIPLHASAIHASNGCIAFAGQSGAGKSTLAASLIDRNFQLLAEDLCLTYFDEDGVRVDRGLAQLRLCDDAARVLGWSHLEVIARLSPDKATFAQKADGPESSGLRRIYALEFDRDSEPAGIRRVEGAAAMRVLTRCLRMRAPLLCVGAARTNFDNLARITRDVEIFRFTRPRDLEQFSQWTDRLVDHFGN